MASNELIKRDPHLDKSLTLGQRKEYLMAKLRNKKFMEGYEDCLPVTLRRMMSADRAINIIGRAASKTPKLLDCTSASLMQCLVDTAVLGLELASPMNHAHPVPFWNSRKGAYEATLVIGFEGYLELMYRAATPQAEPYYETIRVDWVWTNDVFRYNLAGREPPVHEIKWGQDRGEPMMVYLVAFFKAGGHYFESMTMEQLLEHRARYAKKDRNGNWSGPWSGDSQAELLEMGKKTIIRRAQKRLKKSSEMAQAATVDEDDQPLGQRAVVKPLQDILPEVAGGFEDEPVPEEQSTADQAKAALKQKADPPAEEPELPPPPVDDDIVDAEFTENPAPESPQKPQEASEKKAPPAKDQAAEAQEAEEEAKEDPFQDAKPPEGAKNHPKSVQKYLAIRAAAENQGISGEEVDGMARDLGMNPEEARTLHAPGKIKILMDRIRAMVDEMKAAQEQAPPEAPAEQPKESKVKVRDKTLPCNEDEFNSAVLFAQEANLAQNSDQFLSMARFLLKGHKGKIREYKDLSVQDLEKLMEYVRERQAEDEQDEG